MSVDNSSQPWIQRALISLINKLRRLRASLSLLLCLDELMNGLVLMALMLFLSAMIVPDQQLQIIVITGAAFVLMFLLRLVLRHIWQYFLILFIYLALPVLLPFSTAEAALLITGNIIIVARAFILRLKANEYHEFSMLSDQVPAFVIIFILNFMAVRFQQEDVSQTLFSIMTVHLVVAAWRWHAGKLREHMERFIAKPTQPASQIRRYNQLLFAIYAVIALILLTLSPMLGIQRIFPWLGRQLIRLLRFIVSFIKPGEDEPSLPEEPLGEEPGEIFPMPEEPAWLTFLGNLMFFLLHAIFYVGLVAVIISGIFSIYRRFYRSQHNIDISESLVPRMLQDLKKQARQTGKRLLRPFARSDEEKIRDYYERLINFIIKQGIEWHSGMSPRKYAAVVASERGLDMSGLFFQILKHARDQ